MAERGDMTVLHEPFYNLKKFGATDAGERTFNSCASLLAWLRDETHGISVFLKDTTDHRHDDVFADRRFLAEARHASSSAVPRRSQRLSTRCPLK
jgi:hypothetical protein